jgi:iron complex transport system ATP-binding protein
VGQGIVDLAHVYVARGASVVLRDVSLRLGRGEHAVILGPNGCGKSTLLKTITCELYPLVRDETRVEIMGRQRWDLTELKRRMGVVSAEVPPRQALATSGLDAVVTGFFGSSTLWPNLVVTQEMRDHAEDILRMVGGELLREKLVGEMSAGQQRRVMIARAIAGNQGVTSEDNAQMLLLDEPSNALDLAAQQDLRELLRELAAKGTAILLITHHVADVIPEIERVALMRDGRIAADGSKAELLTEDVLSELFGRGIHMSERDGYFNAW